MWLRLRRSGVDPGVVEIAAQVGVAGGGPASRCQMMISRERPMATTAFWLPRRRAMRRYRSSRKVPVRAMEAAALPRTRAR